MRKRGIRILILAVVALAFPCREILAQEDPWEIGARFNVVTAGGEPANDILGFGVFGRYRITDRWLLGFAVDRADYDFERPWKVLGLQQDPAVEVIDAPASVTTLSVWAEREHARTGRGLRWFWSAGLGSGSPDVDDVSGPLAGGGTFDITTDPGSETVLSAAGGLRLPFAKRWVFEFQLRADRHLADWKVRDRVSGGTGSIGGYTGLGGSFALSCRF
jgi:hypothetical protein